MSTRGSTKGLGKAWRPSRKGREELGDPPEGPGRVGRSSRRAGRGLEALPESQDGSGGHPRELGALLVSREGSEGQGEDDRPSWRDGSIWESLLQG